MTSKCCWRSPPCGFDFNSAKDLFEHVVAEHIGRGANAKLCCGWANCNDAKTGK
eukprot:Awhi_evm1s2613